MVFIGTVRAKIPGVKKFKGIRARLLRIMDHWIDGRVGTLVKDTCGTGNTRGGLAGSSSEQDKEEIAAMAYDREVKAGLIRVEFHQATDQGKVGVLHVNSTEPKSGILFLDVLRLKHPDLQEVDLDHPYCSSFEAYPTCPKVLPVDITGRDIEETVTKMWGSGGPSGAGSVMMKYWCTQFSAESESLREEIYHGPDGSQTDRHHRKHTAPLWPGVSWP